MEDGIPGGLQHRYKTCCEKGGHHGRQVSRSLMVDFILLSLFTLFYFSFIFLFLEQLGLGVISHAVTSSHKLMA